MLTGPLLRLARQILPWYRFTQPAHAPLKRIILQSTRTFQAWQNSVCFWACATTAVLIVNVSLTLWASTSFLSVSEITTLIDGDCDKVSRWDTWAHLAINVISMLLLGGSNYTMQCLVAPTREEIDEQHAKARWLDIGVPSFGNLFKIDWRRGMVWGVLAVSSVPLALVYNSVIFKAIGSNDYKLVVATEEFLHGAPFSSLHNSVQSSSSTGGVGEVFTADEIRVMQHEASSYQWLDNRQCISKYSDNFLAGRQDLVVVAAAPATTAPEFSSGGTNDSLLYSTVIQLSALSKDLNSIPLVWICSDVPGFDVNGKIPCTGGMVKAKSWAVFGNVVKGCRSKVVEQRCQLQFSKSIGIIIIVCNLGKVAGMTAALLLLKRDTLCTLGDVMSSFLLRPMPEMEEFICVDDEKRLQRTLSDLAASQLIHKAGVVRSKSQRWHRASGLVRQLFFVILAVGVLSAAGYCLSVGLCSLQKKDISSSLVSLWHLGFGQIGASTLITDGLGVSSTSSVSLESSSKLMGSVLLANTPQGFFSVLYLMYNGLFTCMLTEKEWQTFAHTRMALRVSAPKPGQRSTYYLQLPYLYSGPLIICSGLMHWLISQSIFLAYVQTYNMDGVRSPQYDIVTCGYSPIAIILSMFIGCLMVLAVLLLGLQRYPAGLPLARNRSNLIKAACVRPPQDSDAATSSVMWGLREKDGESRYVFSSYEVQPMPYQAAKYRTAKETWGKLTARTCSPCRQLREGVHRLWATNWAKRRKYERFARFSDKD